MYSSRLVLRLGSISVSLLADGAVVEFVVVSVFGAVRVCSGVVLL